jgi:8-oxo-dGTP pyrophosphatase MutT (NUDIX family)
VEFAEVADRLAVLPDPLPPSLAGLIPTLVGQEGERPPRFPLEDTSARPAAVLVLLFPDESGEARVVLTERVTRDGHHSGEVSFPGGRAESDDVDLAATALREAAEEVGLDAPAAGVRVIGELERLWIPVSNYSVTPVVALAERRPNLTASPYEVARILDAPVAAFLPRAPLEMVEQVVRGWPLRFGAYRVDGLVVWGATARILSQLGAILGSEQEG